MIGRYMKKLSIVLSKKKIVSTHFNTRKSLNAYLNKYNFSSQVILVKGSRGMKMEEFINTIRGKAA